MKHQGHEDFPFDYLDFFDGGGLGLFSGGFVPAPDPDSSESVCICSSTDCTLEKEGFALGEDQALMLLPFR